MTSAGYKFPFPFLELKGLQAHAQDSLADTAEMFTCYLSRDLGNVRRIALPRERIHHPAEPNGNQQESQEGPQDVTSAFREAALGQKRERNGHGEREQQHRLKMIQYGGQSSHSGSPPAADFEGFENGQEIHDPSGGEHPSAVVAGGVGDIGPYALEQLCQEVEPARA
jgi:hypothetical protein